MPCWIGIHIESFYGVTRHTAKHKSQTLTMTKDGVDSREGE